MSYSYSDVESKMDALSDHLEGLMENNGCSGFNYEKIIHDEEHGYCSYDFNITFNGKNKEPRIFALYFYPDPGAFNKQRKERGVIHEFHECYFSVSSREGGLNNLEDAVGLVKEDAESRIYSSD